MSPRTRLIVLIVVVALLFAVTLFVRLFVPNNTTSNSSSRTPGAAKNSIFLKLAGLTPSINLAQLNCNGRRADRPITLTASQPECKLRIGRDTDEPVRSAQLTVEAANLTTYVVGVFKEENSPKAQRDRRTCLTEEDESELVAYRMVVEYEPHDPLEGKTWTCHLKQKKGDAVKIVALEKGGSLTLQCVGCDDPDRQVTFRME